ncbi:ankyrin repeat domain-containing protein [Wolbachia endosymbiont of Mansonella perstans]|uniref:ankyrin repeat domain-containing protein n=1 Tax=Wolbachia endosymbiont of Mansonella perstans TaxID=229526 RepID=UPI001CE19BC5|nr:ankyrin repeat domain-containing protein [Wolbachia endosymbiont of Mansonella perstans]MCA4773946.1 ankyrin repeat domain-containing protein [Wolbachia endosymbiont of Mansonella perstans]
MVESNNSSDILEQIKVELLKQDKNTYEQWKQENFSETYLFDVLFIDGRLRFKCTLLCLAALSGCLGIAKYFVDEKNVDINQASNDGRTALHLAALKWPLRYS